jgi:steroid 5-alpha reductase family enzyme
MVRAFSYFVVLWMLLLPVSSFQQMHLARQTRANRVLPKEHGYNSIDSKLQGLTPLQSVAVACLLPTSLGFLKVEYAVSYGYGAAVALTALLADQAKSLHAMALVFYGVRLCVFLLYREVFIPRFRKFREKIEAKRGSKNRLTRLPVILSCAALYGCMAAPVWITASAAGEVVRTKVFQACVATAWFGFVLGALGDLQKSFVKSQLGEDRLVAGGIFALLRHPNYTGELLGWTANLAAGIVATQKQQWPLLAASVFGWVGITFVLMQAATGLEKKQREKYGELPAYKDWVASSWAGPTFKTTSD